MKRDWNAEKEISPALLPGLLKKFRRKTSTVSFSIDKLTEFEKVPPFLKQAGCSKWEHEEFFCGRQNGKSRAVTLYFELKGSTKAKVLAWIQESGKAANWCLWEKWGDPLIYWNVKSGKLFRYYWLEK